MKHFVGVAIGVYLAVLVGSSSLSWGAHSCSELFASQPAIIDQRVEKNRFVTDRRLYEYQATLHPDFMFALSRLSPDQHWIDLGAGKGNALIDFARSFKNINQAPELTAVAYKLDRWFSLPSFSGKLKSQVGAFESQNTSAWKKADVVTDVFGVLSYTHTLSAALQKTFDLLDTNGELYIETTPYATRVRWNDEYLPLLDFLARIPGLEVVGKYGQIKVIKRTETIKVPNLKLINYKDDAPPTRQFEVVP